MRVRRPILAALAAAVAIATMGPGQARAQDYGDGSSFGIGLFLGEPTGITMKGLLGGGHGIQGTFAFELVYRDRFLIAVDWIWHPSIITSASAFDLGWHVGAGAFFGLWYGDYYYHYDCHDVNPDPHVRELVCDDTQFEFGAHFPVGLDMFFKAVPIEIFIEIAPGLRIVPDVDFSIFGGFGARYFF